MQPLAAAKELLDRGYGKPGQAPPEGSDSKTIEGIVIEPFLKPNGNGQHGPVRLEDWRKGLE
jgi:hypothetical protein